MKRNLAVSVDFFCSQQTIRHFWLSKKRSASSTFVFPDVSGLTGRFAIFTQEEGLKTVEI